MDDIFGYAWDDIQAMQQKQYRRTQLPNEISKPMATDNDVTMLNTLGLEEITRQGLHGIIDRLNNSGLLP